MCLRATRCSEGRSKRVESAGVCVERSAEVDRCGECVSPAIGVPRLKLRCALWIATSLLCYNYNNLHNQEDSTCRLESTPSPRLSKSCDSTIAKRHHRVKPSGQYTKQHEQRWKSWTDILARSFLVRAYPTMKKHNPSTPILIREAQGIEPKVWARYGMNAR